MPVEDHQDIASPHRPERLRPSHSARTRAAGRPINGCWAQRQASAADRERAKQASRNLLAHIEERLSDLNRSWEKEQTKAEIEVFIHDEVYASLPTPPFTSEEKKSAAAQVYAHVWQQAVSGVSTAATW